MTAIEPYIKLLLSLLLIAAAVALWFYTPWSVWAAATGMVGLGIITTGKMISYLFFGGAAIMIFLGYAVQPEVVSVLEMFRL